MKILVADDNAVTATLMAGILTRHPKPRPSEPVERNPGYTEGHKSLRVAL
jgi:hypothetical protein